jgi:diguanylate cyclase (GGDEF)-like protein/PAS domain S-box-containing protein
MKDQSKTKQVLIQELDAQRMRIAELEQLESERKRASEVLRESEEYFKAIIQNSSDIILIVDKIGTITYASPSIGRFLGYESDEVIGKRILDLILSEYKPRAIADFGRALMTKEVPIPNVFRMRHKDGTERVLEGIGNNLFDNSIVAGFVMNVRDITDRKQVEQALRESEERYRTLVENASDMIYRTDENGYFTFVNPAALRVTGYKKEELIGKHYKLLVRPDMFKEAITFFANQLIKGIHNTYYEYPIVTKDGHELWFGQNLQLIMEEDHVVGFQAVVRDISDRKRIEKELSDSEKKYRMMLENIQDGYYEVDLLGNFTFVNPSLSRILGYSEEELIGMNNRQYMDEENAKKVFRAFNMVYKTEAPTSHFDWELIRKDKTKAFVGCSVSLIKDSFDKPVGFRGIIRDITDTKKAEEALQDSEKRYRELSIIDDLTRLYNSRYFYHQLKIEIDRAERYRQPFTLLLLDLDNFKAFNDAYGHVEGDQVLTRLGQVVKRCLRQTDSAYRYGGEEFTILLPMTTSKDAAVTAERIRTEFKKENFFPVPGKAVHLTMSIGLGQYQPQEEMKVFVHRVDQFMYQGKKNGKDRVCSES